MAEIVDFGLQQHKIKMDSRYFENALSVVAGDTGRRIEVQLLDTKGMVQNTTGLSLRLNAVIAGKATFTDATLVDAATGKYQLDLSNGMFLAPGNWQFQWQITDSAGKKLHSLAFTGNVGKNISEGGSQATNFYLNLNDLKEMQDDLVNGTFNSEILETNIAEKLTDLETQYAPKLTEVTAQLAQKPSKEYVDSLVQGVASGAPKNVYATLSNLTTTYPNGDEYFHIVKEDGNWYYWNSTAWVPGGQYTGRTDYIPLTLTEAYISSVNYTQGEGKIIPHYGARSTQTFSLSKGTKIMIHAGGNQNVLILSKWTKAGVFEKGLILGDGVSTDYEYTVLENVEHLRVVNMTAVLPPSEMYVKIISESTDVIQPIYEDVDNLRKDVDLIGYIDTPLMLTLTEFFVASPNHPTIAEGTLSEHSSYSLSSIMEFAKGDVLVIKAETFTSASLLTKWTSAGEYSETLITGDGVTKEHIYTVLEDVEYLRFSNNITLVPDMSVARRKSVADVVNNISAPPIIPNQVYKPLTPELRKPVITFIFDDSYGNDINQHAKFNLYGFKCGFALCTSRAIDYDLYRQYQSEGYSILSHSVNHINMSSPNATIESARYEFIESKRKLESEGLEIKGWVQPNSQLNEKFLAELKKYYEYGYTNYRGLWEPTSTFNPFNTFDEDTRELHRTSMESSSQEDCITAIDRVIETGGMLTFYAHGFPATSLPDAKLTAILDYAKAKADAHECLVLPTNEAYEHYYDIKHHNVLDMLNS